MGKRIKQRNFCFFVATDTLSPDSFLLLRLTKKQAEKVMKKLEKTGVTL